MHNKSQNLLQKNNNKQFSVECNLLNSANKFGILGRPDLKEQFDYTIVAICWNLHFRNSSTRNLEDGHI